MLDYGYSCLKSHVLEHSVLTIETISKRTARAMLGHLQSRKFLSEAWVYVSDDGTFSIAGGGNFMDFSTAFLLWSKIFVTFSVCQFTISWQN
jgi:hypothetical protein